MAFEFLKIARRRRVTGAHFHREVDEMVYGLRALLTSTVDGKRHELRKGDSLFMPCGSVHVRKPHHEPALALTVLTCGLDRPARY